MSDEVPNMQVFDKQSFESEYTHLQFFMLFFFGAFGFLIYCLIVSDVTIDTFSVIFFSTFLGVCGYHSRINLCLSYIKALENAIAFQKKRYSELENARQEQETAASDIAYLRDIFPSIDATIEKHHQRKREWWQEPEKKPREYRTIESYESEIRDLERQIRQLKHKLNPSEVEFIERHY
jgi:hypothetical protein